MAEKRDRDEFPSNGHGGPQSKKQRHRGKPLNRGWMSQHIGDGLQPGHSNNSPPIGRKDRSLNNKQPRGIKSKEYTSQIGNDQVKDLRNLLNKVMIASIHPALLDEETLFAAQHLQQLLAKQPLSHHPQNTLNAAYPVTQNGAHAHIQEVPPFFTLTSLDLPPLPPISSTSLLRAVFSHSSTNAKLNYESLEFLGDAYIEIAATRLIHARFNHLALGQKAQLREALVNNTTLAKYASGYGMGERIISATETFKAEGWTKVLADVFEAYVAGVVLSNGENGFEMAEEWLVAVWAEKLLEVLPEKGKKADEEGKVELAKMLLVPGVKLDYKKEKEEMPVAGRHSFTVAVYLNGWHYKNEWLGEGEGVSVKEAGMAAARDAMSRRVDAFVKAEELKKEAKARKEQEERESNEKASGKN